jgi:PilZ domain-containing protein
LYGCLSSWCTSVIFEQKRPADTVSGVLFDSLTIRRRSPREWIALPVRMLVAGSRIDGVSINLSKHGMYVFAATNLSVGTEIEVTFRQPERKKLVLISGIVRRKAVYLYGIEFLHNIDGDRTLVRPESRTVGVADSTS